MADNQYALTAQLRKDTGKGASRRLRRLQGLVPGIIYGGSAAPQQISVKSNELKKALENEAFYSHILTLDIEGQSIRAVLKDLQRHPQKSFVIHADFQRISDDVEIHMHVPLHFLNEEACVGVKTQGGEIQHNLVEVEVVCLPKFLPEFIAVDLADVALNQIVHMSDLKLPEGVKLTALIHHDDQPVVSVHASRVGGGEETPAA